MGLKKSATGWQGSRVAGSPRWGVHGGEVAEFLRLLGFAAMGFGVCGDRGAALVVRRRLRCRMAGYRRLWWSESSEDLQILVLFIYFNFMD